MKIGLFVNNVDQIGGAEIATRLLAECFARHGHQVVLVGSQAASIWQQHRSLYDYTNEMHLVRLPVWQRSRRTFARTLTAQALWAFPIFLCETQILHLRGLTPETITLAKIARRLGIKTLCVPMASGAHGDVSSFPPTARRDPQAFDWMSALTDPLRDEIVDWGYPEDQISIIPNGVDITTFAPSRSPCAEPNVIFVGQFRPEKRVALLLQAWQQIQSLCPDVHLTLVGGGRYLSQYQQMAAKLGITPTFVPNTDTAGVLTHLQAGSIFVLPGISEGMSNALLEAMAVGLAPIVSDTPANRAVVSPEIDGLFYQADSASALASQLIRLIKDSALHRRLGAAARETAVRRFNLDHIVDQYLELYTQLLGEHS